MHGVRLGERCVFWTDFGHHWHPQSESRPVSTTPTRQRRYVTWRLPDRHFSKVHLVVEPGSTLCGRALPRATGAPHPPIPESEMCTECAAADA
jgi:hypothetical protein